MKMGIKILRPFAAHNKGTLLIEAILVLWILLLSFLLVESLFFTLTKGEEGLADHRMKEEFELFAQALESELYRANFSNIEIQGNKLWFTNSDENRVSYEWRNGRVIRRLNSLGNDIVLLDVRSFLVQWDVARNRLRIEVEFNDCQIRWTEISYITS